MPAIITNSKFQKDIGKVAKSVQEKPYIVTTHGEPKMVVLPYFENNEGAIEDYFEDYEMSKNREKLIEKYKKSSNSGVSDLVI